MNTSYTFWLFYTALSFHLLFALYYSDILFNTHNTHSHNIHSHNILNKNTQKILDTFSGNFLLFTYTFLITNDIKYTLGFISFYYFISML